MATASIQSSFTSGEFSPKLIGRADLQDYQDAGLTVENFVPLRFGGLTRRSGTRFVSEVKDSAKSTRLIPFEFSNIQTYILEFGDTTLRFYRDEGQLTSSGTPVEITTPYSSSQIFTIRYVQSADILFLAHPEVRPKELRRLSDTSWEIVDFDFQDGPYQAVNIDKGHTLSANSAFGVEESVTDVDTSNNWFKVANDRTNVASSGDLIRVYGSTGNDGIYEVNSSSYDGGTNRTQINVVGSVKDATADGTVRFAETITATRDTFAQSDADNNRLLRIKDESSGTGWVWGPITRFVSATEARVLNRAGDTSDQFETGNTDQWRLGSWSARDTNHPVKSGGWPRALTFHNQRLWFGGTTEEPQTLWSSRTASFNVFSPSAPDGTVADDDSVVFTISDDQVNTIEHLVSQTRDLIVFTASGEFVANSGSTTDPITPSRFQVNRHTNKGTTDKVRPLKIEDRLLYVQRSTDIVRDFIFSFDQDSYITPETTIKSDHITGAGLVDSAHTKEPQDITWFVREDGELIGVTNERREKIVAWHRQILGGTFDGGKAEVESAAAIAEGPKDQLWVIVKRTIDGNTKRYVEFMEDQWNDQIAKEDGFFVDSGLTYDGSATKTISGLSHLEGETVAVLGDGAVFPRQTVSSGSITLSSEVTKAQVGLPYDSTFQSMPIVPETGGDVRGRYSRISNAQVRVWRTLGGSYEDDQGVTDFLFREVGDNLGSSPALASTILDVNILQSTSKEPTLKLLQQQPLPFVLLQAIYELQVGGA